MRFAVTFILTFAVALPAARAQDDKLPDGAIMRLGDLRWRFAEHSAEVSRTALLSRLNTQTAQESRPTNAQLNCNGPLFEAI
jgi:hypothetical protein